MRTLGRSLVLRSMDERDAADLLLLFHAFTFEQSRGARECMLQQLKEAWALLFPAFDNMMREEIRAATPASATGKGVATMPKTPRRDFIKAGAACMVAVTVAGAARTPADAAHTVTAERLAALMEAPEPPRCTPMSRAPTLARTRASRL